MAIPPVKVAVSTIAAASLGIATLSFSSTSIAQDGVLSVFSGWRGSATLGANFSTGNSETSNVNGSLRLAKSINRWEHVFFGSVFKGESSIVVTAEGDDGLPIRTIERGDNSDRIAFGYQPKFYYHPKSYVFGLFDWEQDEPSNIDLGSRQIVGVGYRFFSNDKGFLDGEVGVGHKTTEVVTGDDIEDAIGYFGLNYLNRFTDSISFNADFRSDFGSDNTFIEIGLGLSFKVSTRLSANITYFNRRNSGLTDSDDLLNASSDSITTFNLVFDI